MLNILKLFTDLVISFQLPIFWNQIHFSISQFSMRHLSKNSSENTSTFQILAWKSNKEVL